ncbi:uncharacterized protein LOC132293884 [Cornus florida]|uniref:uncharacterized protein LOC132293884 n=1 Tax=Cornus florida TaxID=4283 RepID=UPI00289C7F65|nr:uncharacterized protein LOC132293884 [Cornus florida]XP_059647518.1 uncharacterized protein LOC132293884 [Cornus florida]
MADFEVQKATKKKKRKQRSTEDEERPCKASRVDHSKEPEGNKVQREICEKFLDDPPWRNLQLILSLQNKDIDIRVKVELAFDFVKSRLNKEGDDSNQSSETVSISRVIVFLNSWVQSLLISSEKKIRGEGHKPQSEVTGSCLDYRCWKIFKFCLDESLKLHVSLSFSRDFLRIIQCIARDVLSRLDVAPPHSKDSILSGEVLELYTIVLDSILCVFSSHGGVSNENLDVWVLTVDAIIELVQKILNDELDGGKTGVFVLQLSCSVLDPFTKFLKIHPPRKNGFRDFIDKLLEPLLNLLNVLHLHIHGSNAGWTRNLLELVKEVLSQGLFHPVHIDGFLSLQSTGKYIKSDDGMPKDLKTVMKSYHRHLFDKLENIMAGKNILALGGIGELFCLFVDCVKKQKGASEKRNCLSTMNAETRKSIFDFFVNITELLLLEVNNYLQAELEVGPALMNVHCKLRSINKILTSFMHEKVYIRTEDTSECSHLNFLKVVYNMVLSFSFKINQLWPTTYVLGKREHMEVLNSIAKELVVMVRSLLEIEYEVIGNDLERLWLMMFSYTALGLSLMGKPHQCPLTSEILHLGCQLVNLFSELRQVNNIIFALCKAVRRLVLPDSDGEINYATFMSCTPSLYYESYAKSARILLCSQEFRLAIYTAITSIPEGQASGCIRQLKADIFESLEWMKVDCSLATANKLGKPSSCSKLCFDLQAELLGRGLSDIYTLILDSLTITTGNSNLIGVLVEDLIAEIRPSMSSLVALRLDNVNEIISIVTGRAFDMVAGSKTDLLCTHWVVLFFFRLYMSCRILYRQAISLVPPDTSKKMSEVMGDLFAAYSGGDWLERTDWKDNDYFSWIVQPSASLLTIAQTVSDIYFQDTFADCSPLIYVLNAMALQRLVDLNRLIKSYEYLVQRNGRKKVMDDTEMSLYHEKNKKLKMSVSDFKQEASGLTNFMLEYLPLMDKDQLFISTFDDATYKDIYALALRENETWDFGIGAVNEKSLPCAIWWIVCQNIDIWCTHASKKKLKMFLSLLIQNSFPFERSSLDEFGKHNTNKPGGPKEVTAHQISLQLLNDTVFYEQKFICRHMASRFCRILEKSLLPIFSNFREVDLSSSPNWSEFLSVLDNSPNVVSGNKHVMNDCSSVAEPISHSLNKSPKECYKEQNSIPSISMKFAACQSLLNLLCWMPKGYLNTRSFSLYATSILNLERFVVGSLVDCHGALYSHDHYELFRLFVSCRRALKSLILGSCEEKMETGHSSLTRMLSESSFPVLWLLKSLSAVIKLEHAFSEDEATQVKDMIFSLMDHTSYVFFTLSKDRFTHAVYFLVNAREPCGEQPSSAVVVHEQSDSIKSDRYLDSPKCIDAWKAMVLTAETLKEQALKEKNAGVLDLKKISSIISCFQGFLWGLASALDHIDAKACNIKTKLSRWKFEPIHKINLCMDVFADFIDFYLHVLYVEEDQLPQSLCDPQTLPMLEFENHDLLGLRSCKGSGDATDILYGKEQQNFGTASNCPASVDKKDDSDKRVRKKRSHSKKSDLDSVLSKADLFEQQCLKESLLQGFLRGENPEAAFLLRRLFGAASAILRLNLQINCTSLSSGLVPILIGISKVLLLELANKVEVPQPFTFVCLDGVVTFLEVLGSHFPLTNPISSGSVYAKLIDLHFRAIGKCISLQGKEATLASHETESSTKTLNGQIGLSESTLSHGPYCLNEFKARLRMSFKNFVKKPSELHLLSAIQALERALVGVRKGCTIVYEIHTGSSDGGTVSSTVAAAIDCFDLVLEFVAGSKRSSVVREHIQNLVACLFNIIVHLQGPAIFHGNVVPNKCDSNPDPGSVVLMCVEVLTRVFGKHFLFQMESCHIGQSVSIPAVLFHNLLQLRNSKIPALSNSLRFLDTQVAKSEESMNFVVDRQFSIDLYAASCRLLCTVLKHHKSECERCIPLLEGSVSVLLDCLEMVDIDPVVRKGYFAWELQEGVKCACFLRRIYEEMRQQKDVFGQHCFQFLSNYIWIYSGYGPLRTGIRREIDEALRSGVYALIDACSADDLQHLHTVFGEGPCRSTLATLQHDYKLFFQYEGKV